MIMNTRDFRDILKENPYPGRGIMIGRLGDGSAVFSYFIMGRSANSRNRIFEDTHDGIRTRAFDESKMEDPSLIIYSPVRTFGSTVIVTNGDQTDTVYEGMEKGLSFAEALSSREFEPDGPHFTPRISGALYFDGGFHFDMSILKSDMGRDAQCLRYTYSYDAPIAGEGRFIHTYGENTDPLTSFSGEPVPVTLFSDDIDELASGIWEALDSENKVSLYVCRIQGDERHSVIINKNN